MGIDNLTELAKRYSNCIFYTTHMDDSTRKELEKITQEAIEQLKDYGEKAEFFEEVYSIRPVLKAKRM